MNQLFLPDENATIAFGAQIAKICKAPSLIFLKGNLGAGKTTFVRGFLQHLGYQGAIKSPTYTIVETYNINDLQLLHFDLYRIHDLEELENIGMRDYLALPAITLIEWPEHGQGLLPNPNITIQFTIENQGRKVRW